MSIQVTHPYNPVDGAAKLSKKDISKLKRIALLWYEAETQKTLEILTYLFGEKIKFV